MGRGSSKLGGGGNSGIPTDEGAIHGSPEYGYITDKGITELQNLGFKRWTKNGKDRLYVSNKAVKNIGNMEVSYYNTGNISNVKVDGVTISNSKGNQIFNAFDGTYIDLVTGQIVGMPGTNFSSLNYVIDRFNQEIGKRIYK